MESQRENEDLFAAIGALIEGISRQVCLLYDIVELPLWSPVPATDAALLQFELHSYMRQDYFSGIADVFNRDGIHGTNFSAGATGNADL